MIDIERLIGDKNTVSLRRGGTIKELYRQGDTVYGVLRKQKLEPQDLDLEKLVSFISGYQSRLKKCGIPVIDLLAVEKQDELIVIVTPFENNFLDETMTASSGFTPGANHILEAINLTKGGSVGIDPTPKNFSDHGTTAVYVDLFYPFTQAYVDWVRGRMTGNTAREQYLYFIHDYVFYPKVFAHTVMDLAAIGSVPFPVAFKTVENFCQEKIEGFNLRKELLLYVLTKSVLKKRQEQERVQLM